jgi:hypothetical protein
MHACVSACMHACMHSRTCASYERIQARMYACMHACMFASFLACLLAFMLIDQTLARARSSSSICMGPRELPTLPSHAHAPAPAPAPAPAHVNADAQAYPRTGSLHGRIPATTNSFIPVLITPYQRQNHWAIRHITVTRHRDERREIKINSRINRLASIRLRSSNIDHTALSTTACVAIRIRYQSAW